MDDVEVMKVAESARRLIQNFFNADQFLQLTGIFSFDVVLKGRRAQLNGNVTELPITLRAEISDDILVRVGFPQ